VDIGVSLRFTNLHYNFNEVNPLDYTTKKSFADEFEWYDISRQCILFIEPSFTYGLGYKGVKLRLQLTKTM